MSKFIEVRDDRDIAYYLNVNHIIMVEKNEDSADAVIHLVPANQDGYQTINAKEDFYSIIKLIEE